ncbi:hypothetical protein [Actinoplanes sp. NPDC051851]|uniref:hypothetical protein n=1 Tax=Actinoplanes sp. NPDC051851 TaxID=3154753 RepID=UPI003442F3D2
MTISIGTATQTSARDTHTAWLRMRLQEHSRRQAAVIAAGQRDRADRLAGGEENRDAQ